MSRYYIESNILYRLVKGKFNILLKRHLKKEIQLVTSSIILTDQFNNDIGWERNKKEILDFTSKNRIHIIKAPDMVWHTGNEPKSLPGPFVIGQSRLAGNIWGGDDTNGIRDILGRTMFSNFEDLKKKNSSTEKDRRRWFNCLCDIYHVICAIENSVNYILTMDKDIYRVKDILLKEYRIEIIKYH